MSVNAIAGKIADKMKKLEDSIAREQARRRMNRLEALREIETQAGIQFDPEIVRLLTALLSNDVAADSG